MVRLTDRPDMTLDVYRGRKTTIQQQQQQYMYVKYMYVNLLAGQTNFLFVNHLHVCIRTPQFFHVRKYA